MNHPLFRSIFFWYGLLFAAFSAIAFYAFQSTYLLQNEKQAQEEQQAREHLETLVQVWESGVLAQTQSWLNELDQEKDASALEQRLRRSTPWFDALYIWDKNLYYPPLHVQKTIDVPQNCDTRSFSFSPETCIPPFSSIDVSNFVSLTMAKELSQKGQIKKSLRALQWTPTLDASISEADWDLGIFLSRSLLSLELDPQTIDVDIVIDNLMQLNAPTLYTIPELIDYNSRNSALTLALERIQRRMSAYAKIKKDRKKLSLTKELHVYSDSYGSSPYLFIAREQSRGTHAAVQIDPFLLLKEIFREQSKQKDSSIRPVVLDVQDNLLFQFQELQPEEEVWVKIDCGQLFPHLNAAFVRTKVDSDPLRRQTWSLFFPLILSALIAGLAMLGSVQAERRQREFVDRQQAFVARITHELKTPLAGIRLMAESLQLGIVQSPEQEKQFTERIIAETDRLEKRIDEVLQGTRQAQLKKKSPIDGKKIIADLSKEWSVRFVEHGGILRIETTGFPRIMADKMLLIDALKNLLSNAIKYRKEDRPLRCILKVEEFKSHVEFSVSDNGLGVPPNYRKSIFQRFVRVEGPHRGLSGGHGLGLAFVEETARVHKGSIRCEDGILGGAKFVLRLPKR